MKNQTDLINRMAKLMDSIESGTINTDQAGAIIKAADVVVQVAKTEAAMYNASRGGMQPAFMKLDREPMTVEEAAHELERARIEEQKVARIGRLGRV